MTTGGQVAVGQLHEILTATEPRSLAGVDVLQEQVTATPPQQSRDLLERPLGLRNRAEAVRAHDRVEALVLERQLFGPSLHELPRAHRRWIGVERRPQVRQRVRTGLGHDQLADVPV